MKFSIVPLALGIWAAGTSACQCKHNNDAGRWKDGGKEPIDAVRAIASGGCHQASEQGRLCLDYVNPNEAIKLCIVGFAGSQQSLHDDWFLWTSIQCEEGGSRANLSMI